ncbi:hypothetical protein PHMEG_0001119 [Phytophthora megakarya]|uniref:Uncharacterized protein n=1 Tax=Phytophthora megakarya TaxID=4795 RepID=A0A225X1C7_9STRA|nr:hypothetical protein PHMEG_0001119 [Phytophthora megakarya]
MNPRAPTTARRLLQSGKRNCNRPAAPAGEDDSGPLPASTREEDASNSPVTIAIEDDRNTPAALARGEVNHNSPAAQAIEDGSSSPPSSPSGFASPVQANSLQVSRASIGHAASSPASNPAEGVRDAQSAKRFRLLVRPIIKKTVSQCDKSGKRLDDFVANGDTFDEIIENLWREFSEHVKGLAVNDDGHWSVEPPVQANWELLMQFKRGKHLVDNTKNFERNIIQAFLADVDLLAVSDVIDPFSRMKTLEDTEHQE